MSQWINIDKIGLRGVEADLLPSDRPPNSLDMAVNMRSVGSNLANAGGYTVVPNGTIPEEVIATICGTCPQIFLDTTFQNGELVFDRSWDWDWNEPIRWLSAVEVNVGGQDGDQTIRVRAGECNSARQARIDINVLNTAAGGRRVQILQYDTAGALVATALDYDATSIFSDGLQHWVIVEQYDPGSNIGYNVWIDALQIATNLEVGQGNTERFTSVIRANSPFGLAYPVAFYRFSQSLRDCLSSGNFNGFGRCVSVRQTDAFAFNRTQTDVDLDLYNDDRVATPKIGSPTRRTAYLEHGTIGANDKVYIEWVRDFSPCKSDNYFIGGVLRGSPPLGTTVPGNVAGSWGYTGPSGRFQYDANPDTVVGYENLTMDRTMIAIDIAGGVLYLGGGETDTPIWLGGGTPEAGATAIPFGTSGQDMQLVTNFLAAEAAHYFVSSARSCRHAAPAGFGYLGQP